MIDETYTYLFDASKPSPTPPSALWTPFTYFSRSTTNVLISSSYRERVGIAPMIKLRLWSSDAKSTEFGSTKMSHDSKIHADGSETKNSSGFGWKIVLMRGEINLALNRNVNERKTNMHSILLCNCTMFDEVVNYVLEGILRWKNIDIAFSQRNTCIGSFRNYSTPPVIQPHWPS